MTGDEDPVDRGRLLAVAYRILGSYHDAEDAVQEALVRWEQLGPQGRQDIREPLAWLTRVVSRICLDQLGSARARRERYSGVWLPEPVPGSLPLAGAGLPGPGEVSDPADVVTLDESVSMALLFAMEQLTSAERVSLILHDVFGLPFGEIADVVGRTPDACRQLASSARRQLRSRPRYAPSSRERDAVVAAFAKACADGDLTSLAKVLDPDVVARADGGGVVSAARHPVVGLDRVARYLIGLRDKRSARGDRLVGTLTTVNERTGIALSLGGTTIAVMDLGIRDGLVQEIALIINPEKLAVWNAHHGTESAP